MSRFGGIRSQVSVSACPRRRSGRRGKSKHGTPLPFCAVVVDLAGAARRFVGVATRSPGGSPSRESITQDSRSAVMARISIRNVDQSWWALHPPHRVRGGPHGAVTRVLDARHARDRRLTTAPVVISAYVTTGGPVVTTRAHGRASAQRPRATCAASSRAAPRNRREVSFHMPREAVISGDRSDDSRRRLRCSAGTTEPGGNVHDGGRPAVILACPDGTREDTPEPRDYTALPANMNVHRTYRLRVELKTCTGLKDVARPRPSQLTTLIGLS